MGSRGPKMNIPVVTPQKVLIQPLATFKVLKCYSSHKSPEEEEIQMKSAVLSESDDD